MKIKTLIIFSILFVGIGAILFIRKNKPIDHLNEIIVTTNSPNHSVEDSITYEDFLLEVKSKKQNFTNNNEAKKYLFEVFDNKIPEYWVGTKWDFNGTSRKPKEGTIACGYFVTNILSDLGFQIQRVQLAQAVSSKMIKELCIDIKRFGDFDKLKDYIKNQPNHSIFIIGLDFHTGFVLKTDDKIYFLHSNYIDNQGVVKEEIENSKALKSSKSFMIGNLSENEKLITKWIN